MLMRRSIVLALFTAVAACGTNPAGNPGTTDAGSDGSGNPGDLAFDVTSTDISLAPHQQVTYCYYFKTPNTTPVAIHKWVSDMTAGSHHMIFLVGGPSHADGLDTSSDCGFSFSTGSSQGQWTFSTQLEHSEEDLPADDGTGKPLAQVVAAGTQGAFQMHYLNPGDSTLTVHVELKAYALPAGTAYTQTDAYVTYNQDLAIPPHANALATPPTNGSIWTGSCNVSSNMQFWIATTHSHQQSVEVDVNDGPSTILTTSDWAHPQAMEWNAAPFYTFTSGKVTWTCKYVNDGPNANTTLYAGNDAAHAEMCMMTSYYFPSNGPRFNVQYGGSCFPL
jgi:hypothetical protein